VTKGDFVFFGHQTRRKKMKTEELIYELWVKPELSPSFKRDTISLIDETNSPKELAFLYNSFLVLHKKKRKMKGRKFIGLLKRKTYLRGRYKIKPEFSRKIFLTLIHQEMPLLQQAEGEFMPLTDKQAGRIGSLILRFQVNIGDIELDEKQTRCLLIQYLKENAISEERLLEYEEKYSTES